MTNTEEKQNDSNQKHPRNFIKENVYNIKQIQDAVQMQKGSKTKLIRGDKFRNVPSGQFRKVSTERTHKQITGIGDSSKSKKTSELNLKSKSEVRKIEKKCEIIPDSLQKYSHRSVQTEKTDDPVTLYETGVIKYSSLKPAKTISKNEKTCGDGDYEDTNDLKERDYIKRNIENLKLKTNRQVVSKNPADVPPSYQKGRLPKYLQVKKEDIKEEDDACPVGHVLLPESERKETLKVLRESYADRIQELNALPVRSDTLRVKKRKQEIEEELKKLDSGIKVFQRPKVFVKINS